jgi:hypothetical protein
MICMMSRIGVRTAWTRLLRPAMIPAGMPMARAMTTAASIWARVSMLDSQRPSRPRAAKPANDSAASRQPPKTSPSAATTPSVPGQPRPARRASKKPTRLSTPVRMRPKMTSESRFVSTQSRISLMVSQSG